MKEKIIVYLVTALLKKLADPKVLREIADFILDKVEARDPEPDPICNAIRAVLNIPDND